MAKHLIEILVSYFAHPSSLAEFRLYSKEIRQKIEETSWNMQEQRRKSVQNIGRDFCPKPDQAGPIVDLYVEK